MLLGIDIKLGVDVGANALPSPPGEKFFVKHHQSSRVRLRESSRNWGRCSRTLAEEEASQVRGR